jgi:predicted RND superfamily exporter protein
MAARLERIAQAGFFAWENSAELWRISLRVRATGGLNFAWYCGRVRSTVETMIDKQSRQKVEGLTAVVTGAVPLVTRIQEEMWANLFESFWTALALVCLVMMVALRSIWLGLLAMIPNVFPLVITFGTAAWFSLSLDMGAIMTASIALGIAVDDTAHFLTWFRRGRAQGRSRRRAVVWAYQNCGTAMIHTSMICGLSLLVFVSSAFVPAARFGLLMCLLLMGALVGDLVLLPTLLAGSERTQR